MPRPDVPPALVDGSAVIIGRSGPAEITATRMNYVTQILSLIESGDPNAAEQLLPLESESVTSIQHSPCRRPSKRN